MVSTLGRKLRRDLGRHRSQFGAVTLMVFLGITMFAASFDSFRNLEASYAATATQFRFANLTAAGGDVAAIAAKATSTDGVAAVATRTVLDLPIRVGGAKFLGRAVSVPDAGEPQVNQLLVLEGTMPGTGAPSGAAVRWALVEEHMAEHFGLGAGDTVELLAGTEWTQLEVAGVVSSPEYIWPARSRNEVITTPDNFGVVFLPESLVADLALGAPNEVLIYYTDGTPSSDLTTGLTDAAVAAGAIDVYPRALQPSNAALEEDLAGFAELSAFFPILFLTAAALAAYVTITRLVYAQRPHIGVLLANGFSRGQVLRHYLGYGLVPGLAGAIPGAVAGVVLARFITSLYTGLLAVPVTLISFYPTTLLAAAGFGIGAALLAALAPALVASRVAPAEAMRGTMPSGPGKPSLIERLLPPVRRLPVRWRMAMRGVGRNPRRTAYTILGVVLSLMLVLVSWGMIDTVRHLMERQFTDIQQEDARVYFAGPTDASVIAQLATVEGIAAVEPVLEAPVSIDAGAERYQTGLIAMPAATQMRRFYTPNGTRIDLPANGLLLGRSMESRLGVAPGDQVSVTVEGAPQALVVAVAAYIDEPLGTLAYASFEGLSAAAQTPLPATSAAIRYADGYDAATVRPSLIDLEIVAAFEDANAIYDVYQRYLTLFYVFVGVMLLFGGAMAFALIFSAMSVNIAERSREVGTLLAVGTKRSTVSRLVTVENLVVAVLGVVPGLFAGYWIAKYAMASFASDMFSFDLYIAPLTYAASAAAILGVALLSQWPGIRALRRLDIPKIVKERSV